MLQTATTHDIEIVDSIFMEACNKNNFPPWPKFKINIGKLSCVMEISSFSFSQFHSISQMIILPFLSFWKKLLLHSFFLHPSFFSFFFQLAHPPHLAQCERYFFSFVSCPLEERQASAECLVHPNQTSAEMFSKNTSGRHAGKV